MELKFHLMKKNLQPLSGVRVLDLSRLIPGPFCSLILANLGAQVIKLEDPRFLDYVRDFPPSVEGVGVLYRALNDKKEFKSFSFTAKKDARSLELLIKKTDVLIESFRPGVLKRLGWPLSRLKKINPRLVVASITGYGQTGSNRKKAGHDLNYLSLSGLINPPEMPVTQWADLVGGGVMGALAILSALYYRKQTKNRKGLHLDISMTDAMNFVGLPLFILGQFGESLRILSGALARYNIYKTSDGKFISLAALEEKFWRRFCGLAGFNDLANKKYSDLDPKVHKQLKNFFMEKTQSQWVKWAEPHDICLTPVLNPAETIQGKPFRKSRFTAKKTIEGRNLFFPKLPVKMKKL